VSCNSSWHIDLSKNPPNEDHNGKNEEKYVTNELSKFQLNRMVNEPGNVILPKLCRLEKSHSPNIRKAV